MYLILVLLIINSCVFFQLIYIISIKKQDIQIFYELYVLLMNQLRRPVQWLTGLLVSVWDVG